MKVGIIGAGTMGSGIAQAFAQTEGYEVMLCDINETFAANGKNRIAKTFEKMERFVVGWFGATVVICLTIIGCTNLIKPTLREDYVDDTFLNLFSISGSSMHVLNP